MKNFFLGFRNKKLIKNAFKRSTVSFAAATKFGFICESLKNYQILQPVLKEITNNGSFTKVIVQVDKRDPSKSTFPSFNSKDIDWLGKSKSTAIDLFKEEKFDYLFYLGDKHNATIESLILGNPSNCRVGFYHEDKSYLYDFMYRYQPEKSREENIKEVLSTLKKIKVNEG